MTRDQAKALRHQAEYFQKPDARRFWWMTRNSYFSSKEKELLHSLSQFRPSRVLEVGCGEGGNLVNLQDRPDLLVGLDIYEDRCRFAQEQYTAAQFVCGNGYHLPFRTNSFDLVFCRDLLHHVSEKKEMILEMVRVCRPNGHIVAIEACGRNPVIFCLAIGLRAERGLLHCGAATVQSLFQEAGLLDVTLQMQQPLPLYRIMLHPRYGLSALGEREWYRRWADRFDNLCARIVPRHWWAYAVVSGRKPV